MANPLLVRKKQLLRKIESVAGTAETLAASDGGVRINVAGALEPDEPVQDRDIARSSLTRLGKLPGEKAGAINYQVEFNTPDSITANPIEMKTDFRACGYTINDAKGISIGSVSGAYTRGETLTDASGNTGRCLIAESTGNTTLFYATISALPLQSAELITGSDSGATATSSSASANAGYYVKPVSNNQETATIRLEEDGYQWTVKGAMGNFTGTFEASRAALLDFSLQGPKHSYGDQSLTTGISYQTEQPPIMQGSGLTINGVPVVYHSITVDAGNTVVNRIDGNASDNGFIAAFISGRDPKVTISFEHVVAATLDTFGLLAAGTKVPIAFHVGSAATKKIWVFGDLSQVTNISLGDKDGLRTIDVEFSLTGAAASADDELEMVFV